MALCGTKPGPVKGNQLKGTKMTNEELKAGLEAALEGTQEVTQEGLDKIVEDIREEASEHLGPQTFVKGWLDHDNQGVLLRVKQPSAGLRLEAFVNKAVKPLPEPEDDGGEPPVETKAPKKKKKAKVQPMTPVTSPEE